MDFRLASEMIVVDKNTDRKSKVRRLTVWLVRICFSFVFLINIQCALQFIIEPQNYAASFELSGFAGNTAVAGIGIAFLMWNATYPAFIAAPLKFRVLGWVVLAQQLIGVIGETAILANLPASSSALAASIERFIVFDGIGLIIMATSFATLLWIHRRDKKVR